MKTRELLLETSTSGKCSGTCLCCFTGAKKSIEDHAVTLHESWGNNKILWLTGWAKSTTDPTLSKNIHFQTVFLPTFFCNLKNLSFPVSKMLRSILNPFSHSFLVEFRVEGKTLLKQFNQSLKNLEKRFIQPKCAYIINHVQVHSQAWICWKLRDVRLPLPYSTGRKNSNPVPFFPEPFSHPAKHLPAVPDVLSITRKMNGGGDKAAGSARCWLIRAGAQLRERVPKRGEEKMGKAENPISAWSPHRVILVYAAGSLLNCTMTHTEYICRLD